MQGDHYLVYTHIYMTFICSYQSYKLYNMAQATMKYIVRVCNMDLKLTSSPISVSCCSQVLIFNTAPCTPLARLLAWCSRYHFHCCGHARMEACHGYRCCSSGLSSLFLLLLFVSAKDSSTAAFLFSCVCRSYLI